MNKWIIPKSVKKFVVGWIRTYKWIKLNKKKQNFRNILKNLFWTKKYLKFKIQLEGLKVKAYLFQTIQSKSLN